MNDYGERMSPWLWPAHWFRDEGFWRAIVVGCAIALVACAGGWLSKRVPWSVVWRLFADGTLILPAVFVVMAVASVYLVCSDRAERKRQIRRANDLLADLATLSKEIDALPD